MEPTANKDLRNSSFESQSGVWLCKLSSGWTLSHHLVAWSSISHIWFLLELRKSSRTFASLIVIYYVAVYCLCLVHLLRIFKIVRFQPHTFVPMRVSPSCPGSVVPFCLRRTSYLASIEFSSKRMIEVNFLLSSWPLMRCQ